MDSEELKKIIQQCKNLRVLYVEDEQEVRLQTFKMMQLCFEKIFVAQNGEEGLAYFKNESIDLVFTDINMPKMDGLSMIEAIRSMNAMVPIIVFSAYDYPDYFLKTIKHGIAGYLLKPFQFQEIVELLQKLIEQNRLGKRVEEKKHSFELVDGFYWDKKTQSLCKGNQEIKLTKRENDLFELMTSSKQRVFSTEEIEITVFDDDVSDNKRVRYLLSRLRQKLDTDVIQSIYGQGYKLKWRH